MFRSPALPVRVCDHCRTSVMRIDEGVRDMGRAAVLPFDVSPVRMGTEGVFDGQGFAVIGRVRWGWSAGSWNEWLFLFADGAHGWLGDAMGEFSVLRERPVGELIHAGPWSETPDFSVGTSMFVDGEPMTVSDSREVRCIAAEGELPFVAPAGWTVHSIDLRGPSGAAATLQRDAEETSFYVGRYVTLAELRPRNLRSIDGWPLPAFAA